MPLVAVNYLAVLLAAVVAMAVGALWYSPLLFGKAWIKLSGYSESELKAAKEKGMTKQYGLTFVGVLVTAFVLAQLLALLGSVTLLEGVQVAFWVWLGFNAPVILGTVLWDNKPWGLYLINTLHYLVALILMGGILAVWF